MMDKIGHITHTYACYDVSESQTSVSSSKVAFYFLLTDPPTPHRRSLTGCSRHPARFLSILPLVSEYAEPFAMRLEGNWIDLEKLSATVDHDTDHNTFLYLFLCRLSGQGSLF